MVDFDVVFVVVVFDATEVAVVGGSRVDLRSREKLLDLQRRRAEPVGGNAVAWERIAHDHRLTAGDRYITRRVGIENLIAIYRTPECVRAHLSAEYGGE